MAKKVSKFLRRLGLSLRRSLSLLKETDPEKKLAQVHQGLMMEIYRKKVVENALNVGDKLPIDELQNCFGETVDLKKQLEKGPLVIKFHRGTWCCYCKADLAYFQKFQAQLAEEHATAIAISTEIPEKAIEMTRAHGYKFHMVGDPTTEIARKFGLLFSIDERVADAVMDFLGIDLTRFYGTSEVEVALPATYVINREGVVIYAFIDEDFRNRANIEEVLHFVKKANMNKNKYLEKYQEEDCPIRNIVKCAAKKIVEKRRQSKASFSAFFSPSSSPPSSHSLSSSSSFTSTGSSPTPSRSKSVKSDHSGSETSSITSSEYERDPLRYCLQNEEFLESFKTYLEKTFCMENLLFYVQATEFLDLTDEGERKAKAARIYETFIQRGSVFEVNIDDTTREKITRSYSEGEISMHLFASATKEVYHLMETDSFNKWKKTREFSGIWQKNGSLDFLNPLPSFVAAAAA